MTSLRLLPVILLLACSTTWAQQVELSSPLDGHVRAGKAAAIPVRASSLSGASLPLSGVGDVVRDNLINLGHLDLKADGRTEPKLPGDVSVRVGDLPLLNVGDTFKITRPADQTKEQKT